MKKKMVCPILFETPEPLTEDEMKNPCEELMNYSIYLEEQTQKIQLKD